MHINYFGSLSGGAIRVCSRNYSRYLEFEESYCTVCCYRSQSSLNYSIYDNHI